MKNIVKGNEACRGGDRAGYVIVLLSDYATNRNYVWPDMNKAGGTFLQAESEVAAINMV